MGLFTLLKHLHPPLPALPPVCGVFQAIHSVAWHHEGKQFICSHSDGTLTIWNIRGQGKPVQTITPHGKAHACQTCTKRQLCRRGNCVVSCRDYRHFNYTPPPFAPLLPPALWGGRVSSFDDAFFYVRSSSSRRFLPTWRRPLWDEAKRREQRGNKGSDQSKDGLLTCVSSCFGVWGIVVFN